MIGGSQKRWVRMVKLGGNWWEGLCTEWVILNKDECRRKWFWNTGAGEAILEAWRGNYPYGNHIPWG